MAYPVKKISFDDIENEDFRPRKATIYEIMWDDVKFELLINYVPDSNKLATFGTGDIDRKKNQIPIFSRARWRDLLGCSAIYYSDPTLYLTEKTGLCWCYGVNERWYLEDIAYLIYTICKKWSVQTGDILCYGSSGGGYTAIMLAVMLHAKASVINSQLILPNFWERLFNLMKETVLKPGEELIEERISVVPFIKKEQFFPQLHILQNVCAVRDLETQLAPFLTELSNSKYPIPFDRLRIEYYYDEAGHGGMPSNEYCINGIKKELEQTFIDDERKAYPPDSIFCKLKSGSMVKKKEAPETPSANGIFGKLFGSKKTKSKEAGITPIQFDKYIIPPPKLLFSKPEYKRIADGIVNNQIQVMAALPPMPYELKTLDWNVQWSDIPNSFQLYLQGLSPMGILLSAFEMYGDMEYLVLADEFLRSWEKYANDKKLSSKNMYSWCDHAVSLRAECFILFGKVAQKTEYWSDELAERLRKLLTQHGEWLFSDEHYAVAHNHGIMQDQALLYTGMILENIDFVEYAKYRLKEQEKAAFNEEMVHVENSPAYARKVMGHFRDIGMALVENGDSFGEEFIENMEGAQEYFDWMIKPNGIIAQIGDTTNSPGVLYSSDASQKIRKNKDIHKTYPVAGVYFYRSQSNKKCPEADTWKMLKSGYCSTTHKHADDTSFMLYSKGYEIFSDCGSYGYNKKAPERQYIISSKAHNVVLVDDSSYPCTSNNMSEVGMHDYYYGDGYDCVSVYNNAYKGVNITRDFYSADDLTIISDTMESDNVHTYSQIFHLSEKMEVFGVQDDDVLIRIADSGYIARIKQYGDLPALSVIQGDTSKVGYGLISRATGHIEAITTLKFDKRCKNGNFVTVITIEDAEGNVRLFDKKINESDILFSDRTFELKGVNRSIPLSVGEDMHGDAPVSAECVFNKNDLVIDVFAYEHSSVETTFAYYLIKDGKTTERIPYGKDRRHVFTSLDSGEYQVKYYIRRDGEAKSYLTRKMNLKTE